MARKRHDFYLILWDYDYEYSYDYPGVEIETLHALTDLRPFILKGIETYWRIQSFDFWGNTFQDERCSCVCWWERFIYRLYDSLVKCRDILR